MRALDEAEFWKRQEADHTTVIQAVTPNLEAEYVEALKEYERSFEDAYGDAIKHIQTVIRSKGEFCEEYKREMIKFLKWCISQSNDFVNFLNYVVKNSTAVNGNNSSQAVIYHIIRESKYFVGIEKLIL